jgi:hypothetical protein
VIRDFSAAFPHEFHRLLHKPEHQLSGGFPRLFRSFDTAFPSILSTVFPRSFSSAFSSLFRRRHAKKKSEREAEVRGLRKSGDSPRKALDTAAEAGGAQRL